MELNAYMDRDGRWYVDDANGFTKAQNELVAGVPQAIRHFVPSAQKVVLRVEAFPFSGSVMAVKLHQDRSGATFRLTTPEPLEFWLCPVLFYYMPLVPKHIFVAAHARDE